MVTMAEAYAIDPATGGVNMDLFREYAAQQDNINMRLGSVNAADAGLPSRSDMTLGLQYLQNNPDVFNNAISRANSEGLAGGDPFANRLDEIAIEHFNSFGRNEGRSGFGYTPPEPGSFTPGPFDTPAPFTPPPGNTGGNTMPGTQPGNTVSGPPPGSASTFDNSGYQTALNNFGGLLNNYGDFFGGLLSGAQNATTTQPDAPASGFYGPGQQPGFYGFNSGQNFSGMSGGGSWNSGSSWGAGPSGSANTGHRQLWTT